MLRICYKSRVRPSFGLRDFDDILGTAQVRNASDSVTGLLLFDGRGFLQAIEGAEPKVRAAFDRIKADPRHYDVVVIESREIEDREFGRWSMQGRNLLSSRHELYLSVTADVAAVSNHKLRALFVGFASLTRRL